ncbi:transcriptional regulator [Streptomyces sp. Ag109_G2-6]|uniref:LysR family transcriptional regulator n=1 Tax=Streptomyces TaxID=1883 RepID=UPI0009A50338|nr:MULTISPECIES: LysR substrate-binding domain-containing protein [Streptomyces]RPF44626.1 transcriptional regulator [Streptomyces sp. Ag109_G2-6]
MDLPALRCFQVVARHEHISRAAAELRVAQPSVSRTVARLEADLGVELFERRGRRIRLNRHGAAFLRRVDRALGELEDGRRELAQAAGAGSGSVTVASETLMTLAALLPGWRRARPGVDLRLRQCPADAMAHLLRTREADLCLAAEPLAGPGLESVELLREEVLLAVPAGHRLAGRQDVAVAELAGEPFLTPGPGHWQRELADRLFAREGLRPAVVCEGDEPGALLDLVGAGLGVALLPAMAREAGLRGAVAWARLEGTDSHRVLWLVRDRTAFRPAAVGDFAAFVLAHFRAEG